MGRELRPCRQLSQFPAENTKSVGSQFPHAPTPSSRPIPGNYIPPSFEDIFLIEFSRVPFSQPKITTVQKMRAQTAFWPAAALLIVASSLLLMCPLESRAEMRMSPELDEMRKELGELRSRVQELMAAANGGSANELLEKRAMLPYSGGIYGKRAAILPYSGGIYGKRSLLDAAEPYLLNRPSRAVPFNGGIFGR